MQECREEAVQCALCKRGGEQEGGSTYYTMQEILGAEEGGSTVLRRRVQEGGSQA